MTRVKNPKAARNIALTEIVNVRIRKRLSGTIGSATRDSIQTKIAAKTRPMAMRPPTAGSDHWPVCLFVRPMRTGAMASAKTSAPM